MSIGVWFRADLRLQDNPALYYACQKGQGVIGIYIATPKTWQRHDKAACQIDWMFRHLKTLKEELKKLNIPLLVKQCDYFSEVPQCLEQLIKSYKLNELHYNQQYEWDERRRDNLVEIRLKKAVRIHTYHDQCLTAPGLIKNSQEDPYKVFTPYKKAVLAYVSNNDALLQTLPQPPKLATKYREIANDWEILTVKHDKELSWCEVGEKNAHQQLALFVDQHIDNYDRARDYPFLDKTSRLSPYLALGVLSPRQCLQAVLDRKGLATLIDITAKSGASVWLSELIWRDFYRMICFCFPKVSRGQPFIAKTKQLSWHQDPEGFKAWCQGRTGIPIVDAAMRQLNQTGFMHNRLRMITAMFLTKNLFIDWHVGERYFMQNLLDGDFASNNGGWQWCASTGVDAAPYFRIFNPVTQSAKFDANGDFIRSYVPALRSLKAKEIHAPHKLKYKIENYPSPIVDLKASRAYTLSQFKAL